MEMSQRRTLSLGLHKKGSTYDILNTDDCKLVHKDMTDILTCVREFQRKRSFLLQETAAHRLSAASDVEKRCYFR